VKDALTVEAGAQFLAVSSVPLTPRREVLLSDVSRSLFFAVAFRVGEFEVVAESQWVKLSGMK
jgi:hypothetical protein